MHELIELKENLCEELKEYSGKENYSSTDIEKIDDLTDIVKNLGKIIKDYEKDDYSNMGYYNDGGMNENRSYRGNSYARGRGANARRDSRGRYSNRMPDYYYDDEMMSELMELREKAPDERTRKEFDRFMSKIKSM